MPLHIVIASLSPWICTKSHGFSPMLVVPRVSAVFLLSVVAGPCTAPQVRLAVNALTRCHRIVVPLDLVAQETMAPRSCSSFRSTSSHLLCFPYPTSIRFPIPSLPDLCFLEFTRPEYSCCPRTPLCRFRRFLACPYRHRLPLLPVIPINLTSLYRLLLLLPGSLLSCFRSYPLV